MAEPEKPLEGTTAGNDYNSVFEKLVDEADGSDATLVGLVAYGFYKISKRDWAMQIRDEAGRKPTTEELHAFARSQTDTVLDGYRSQADNIVATYANSVLKTQEPVVYKKALEGSFMRSFWPSFWASVTFAVVLVMLGIVLAWQGVSLPIKFGT